MSYAIHVGRDKSADGVAYLAGYGDEPSGHWLEIVDREEHAPGETIRVGVTPAAAMPGRLSDIPQVAVTARHLRVSYSAYRGTPAPLTNGGLNEHGVAVRDVWSPSHPRLVAMTPSDQAGPNYSDLARLVLERARTAREGVELIGELIAEHGCTSYGGNSHLIADADEGWVVIEFAGGRGLWVAERLGPGAIRVSRPGYIHEVPPDFLERPDFQGSEHLIRFALEAGWYDPASGPFDANAMYGDGLGRWRGVVEIESRLVEIADRAGVLAFADIAAALRDPRYTGDTAGYGQIVPLRGAGPSETRILWHAPVGPVAAPFTPFFLGVEAIPSELRRHRYLGTAEAEAFMDERHAADAPISLVSPSVESTRSAVAIHRRLLYLAMEHPDAFLPELLETWPAVERSAADELPGIESTALALIDAGRPDLARAALTRWCGETAIRALDLGEAMARSVELRSRVRFGLRDELGWRGPEQVW